MGAPRFPRPALHVAPPLPAGSAMTTKPTDRIPRATGSLPATVRAAARWGVAVRVLHGGGTAKSKRPPRHG